MLTDAELKDLQKKTAQARAYFDRMNALNEADRQRPAKRKRPQVGDREVIGLYADTQRGPLNQ